MSNPVLDERGIISLLKTAPTTSDSIAALQAGAVQALIDLFDRKVTRDVFTDNAGPCLALYGQCSKLWVLHNIHDVFTSDNLTEERFKKAESELADLIRAQAETLIDLVKRLQACPTDLDKVH